MLIPYAALYFVTWIWWFLVVFLRHPELFDHSILAETALLRPLFGFLLAVGYPTPFSTMTSTPLWFLVSLFTTTVMGSVLFRLRSRNRALIASVALAAAPLATSSAGIDLFFSLDGSLMGLPFYVAGKLAREGAVGSRIPEFLKRYGWALCAPGLVVLALLLSWVTILNGRVDINLVRYGASPALFYVGGFGGIAFVAGVSLCLSNLLYGPTIVRVANATIAILGLHGVATQLIEGVLRSVHAEASVFLSLGVAFAVVLVILPVSRILEAKVPFLVGNRGGPGVGRGS